ncbi:rhodanese-like domain-containing protein [Shimia ponticola]|uniref:rhodanese-like domain-containing protein n=1 Tax=Shimia ponticola TaxID=2582893 RepID=UPI00164B4222|nr:rhodanese-like domain-containing protein [Shimia ponticola]
MSGLLKHARKRVMPTLMAATMAVISLTIDAGAEPVSVMSAPQIQAAVESEERILIDIRSEAEWKESGLAKGAFPVSMHDPQFGANLSRLFQIYGPDRMAMICATGGRTAYIANVLKANGITGVIDVSEGMFGNGKAPGWIERGLPVVSLEAAQAAYEAALAQ